MLGAFGWSHSMAKKTQEQMERSRKSFHAILPRKKREANEQNEARLVAEQQVQQVQYSQPETKKKRSEPSL